MSGSEIRRRTNEPYARTEKARLPDERERERRAQGVEACQQTVCVPFKYQDVRKSRALPVARPESRLPVLRSRHGPFNSGCRRRRRFNSPSDCRNGHSPRDRNKNEQKKKRKRKKGGREDGKNE